MAPRRSVAEGGPALGPAYPSRVRSRPLRLAALAGVTAALVAPGSAPAQTEPLIPPRSYYRPVIVEGFTFPVARANWLSVIELAPDWHDPRFRLIDGTWQLVGVHEGNDIGAEEGTPIVSASSGTVEAVGWTFYSGTRVGIRGTDGKYYFYAHLSEVAPGVQVGTSVQPGQVLGRVGNTGYGPPAHEDEFPPHLHFGIEGPLGWENPYPLVRRLYRASVRQTLAGERELAALAGAGDREGFLAVARRLYADLG
jgi:murein DD-endopeptidase MepM/ murein hydrolase activator NlpD